MVMGSAYPKQLHPEPLMLSEALGTAPASPLSLLLREVSKHAAFPAETWLCCLGKMFPGDLPPTTRKGLENTLLSCLAGTFLGTEDGQFQIRPLVLGVLQTEKAALQPLSSSKVKGEEVVLIC